MNKLEDLLRALKAHPPKFFIGDTVYTFCSTAVVKCIVDSITIEWEEDEVYCRYNLYTEEDANGHYDMLYGYDEDTFADEASAKRKFIVPQLRNDINSCKSRIEKMQEEIAQLRTLKPKERIKDLEQLIRTEELSIAKKEEQIKECEEG